MSPSPNKQKFPVIEKYSNMYAFMILNVYLTNLYISVYFKKTLTIKCNSSFRNYLSNKMICFYCVFDLQALFISTSVF
jgi:hypothetical protein